MPGKKRILILCTGNSCRSQMAEGWVNHELRETWVARSAGTRPAEGVHPRAIKAMDEVGIDISEGRPENVEHFLDEPWDLVITVCDSARETCPVFPDPVETLHVSFPDPADATGSTEDKTRIFREVRDSIREKLLSEIDRRSEPEG